MPRKRNPQQFTIEEAQTATLIMTEGFFGCYRDYTHPRPHAYIEVGIQMCDREALEPAVRTFKTSISHYRTKRIACPPELFPPDGKGIWRIRKRGKGAEQLIKRLTPLLSKHTLRKWEQQKQKCRV